MRAWNYERTLLNDQASLETVPSLAVMGEVVVEPVAPTAKLLLTQRSSKLVDILKVLLCYSNNFMAERIGEALGGPESVRQRLNNRSRSRSRRDQDCFVEWARSQPHFAASDDEDLRELRVELKKHGLIAGSDHAGRGNRSRHTRRSLYRSCRGAAASSPKQAR